MKIESEGFVEYIQKLSEVTGSEIKNFYDLINELEARLDYFHKNRCRITDHSLERVSYY